jgi:DNA primase
LSTRFSVLARRGTWISLRNGVDRQDAGWRGPQDYTRGWAAVRGYVKAVKADIYPLSLTGDTCFYCFSGDTEYWTAEGVKTFAATVGTTQRVLTRQGAWVDAPVRLYGESTVDRVVLKRGKVTKVVEATSNHHWHVRVKKDDARHEYRTVTTEQLKPGDRLSTTAPASRAKSGLSPIGIMAGVVYGDGHLPTGRNASVVVLYDEKRELAKFFAGCDMTTGVHASTGREVDTICSLPRFMKSSPNLEESRSYLLGWLAGYAATDGSVHNGQLRIHSVRRECIETVRAVAARVGIATYSITERVRTATISGRTYTGPIFGVQLRSADLPEDFLLRSRHIAAGLGSTSGSLTWVVQEVQRGHVKQPVYCVEVPGDENFTLEGWIGVGNCPFREGICGGVAVPDEDYGRPEPRPVKA